jgi:hypothetical protein
MSDRAVYGEEGTVSDEHDPADGPRGVDEELPRQRDTTGNGPDRDLTRGDPASDPDSPGATIDSDEPAEPNEPG